MFSDGEDHAKCEQVDGCNCDRPAYFNAKKQYFRLIYARTSAGAATVTTASPRKCSSDVSFTPAEWRHACISYPHTCPETPTAGEHDLQPQLFPPVQPQPSARTHVPSTSADPLAAAELMVVSPPLEPSRPPTPPSSTSTKR